jgi:hypothetical protein
LDREEERARTNAWLIDNLAALDDPDAEPSQQNGNGATWR